MMIKSGKMTTRNENPTLVYFFSFFLLSSEEMIVEKTLRQRRN